MILSLYQANNLLFGLRKYTHDKYRQKRDFSIASRLERILLIDVEVFDSNKALNKIYPL